MDILIYFCFGILGLAVGSFLNLCSDRLPAEKSIAAPRSHCDRCGETLKPIDLVPVLSYLWLRGRCRNCGARIPLRNLVVEIAAAAMYALLAWRFGLTLELAAALVYGTVFLLVFVIDMEHRLILNVVIYPAMVVAFGFLFFWGGFAEYWPQTGPGIVLSGLLGAAVGYCFLLLPYAITRGRGMGYGDVRLAALIGLVTGFPLVVVALLVGIIGGGLVAVALLMTRVVRSRKEAIPYGPFLAVGAMAALVWGDTIFRWWLGLGS